MIKKTVVTTFVFCFVTSIAFSQMERERVAPGGPVEEMFWTPNIVGMSSVQSLPKSNLNVTIMHNFGVMNDDIFHNFFGMDFGATVRLGIDYGITDRWSVGVGRTLLHRLYDFRTKYALLKQTESNSIPVSISVKGDLGINSSQNGFMFEDRLNYFSSIMIARKLSDALTLQLTPMYAHFNTPRDQLQDFYAVGIGGEYRLSRRWAIIGEYYPVIGDRPSGTKDAVAIGVNIETGGHVFQLFLKSSNWHTEQQIIVQNRDDFWNGDIRFGFNVNRIFRIGKK